MFLLSFVSNAQKEASIWYFGEHAGLDFSSGVPVTLEDGQLNTQEGCATISDASGNLLFYTDGSRIWDQNHQIMPNGTGLLGDFSSTQSAIIVPRPNNPDLYYVFTVAKEGEPAGINYSEVDMTLNGGMGAVVSKNVSLHGSSMEKLTAVKHANGRDIWVLTHDWNNADFVVFLVTPTGVDMNPVVTTVGRDMSISDLKTAAIGYLKASPDGSKVAISHRDFGSELLDFDNATGVLSNPIVLNNSPDQYGVEFSPSSKVLYLAPFSSAVYQYDLTAADIPGSAIVINNNLYGESGMQLALDGKIYMVLNGVSRMSVIHNPDVLGAGCNYERDAIDLGTGRGFLGLPPFIQSYFYINDIQANNLCFGQTTDFSVNVSEPITSILWDFGDGNSSTMEAPSQTYSAFGSYTVEVTVTTASGTDVKSTDIIISEVPVAQSVSDVEVCTGTVPHQLDLTTLDSEVLGSQDPTAYEVAYFESQSDADNNTNSLNPLMSFGYGSKTIFARVSNTHNPSCYDTTSFDVIVKQAPDLFVPSDWVVCDTDGDGLHFFDLTTKDAEILNGQDASLFNVSYYASALDAENRTNPLNANHNVSVLSETLFYRIENAAYPECFETGSFSVGVINQVMANKPTDLEICDPDNDKTAQFDLSLAEAEILGTQSSSSVILSYHESQADADANLNPLPNVITSNQYQNTIYVRVSNAQDTSCYDTNSFQLNIYDVPEVPEVPNWQVCDDDNDGIHTFDLDEKGDEIFAGVSGTSLAFYESEADASLEQNPIYGNYQNTSNPQTVYFRLNNSNNTACYSVGSFNIEVFDTPLAYAPTDFVVCDDEGTGSYPFNLAEKDEEVLNGQDSSTYEVTYYSTEQDAIIGEEKLAKEDYFNLAITETIYARVEHKDLSSCYDITNFDLIVNPLPSPDLQEIYVICPDSPNLVLDAGTFESYQWEDADGNVMGNEQTLDVNQLGTYFLTVTETQNGLNCSSTVSFEVVSSGASESFEVATDGFSDRITMTVDAVGTGDFEYSIDGWTYQSSNQFEVFPGAYTVYVRDPLGCRTISEEVIAIGYQKFFSPNGDGINDYWNIIGGELYSDAQLFLYDRYGKLIVQLSPQGSGWDGTILGRPMPSTDYWFKYVYDNGKTYAGHFSLRR